MSIIIILHRRYIAKQNEGKKWPVSCFRTHYSYLPVSIILELYYQKDLFQSRCFVHFSMTSILLYMFIILTYSPQKEGHVSKYSITNLSCDVLMMMNHFLHLLLLPILSPLQWWTLDAVQYSSFSSSQSSS